MRRLSLPLIAAVAVLAVSGLSFAYWTASGSGSAAAAIASFVAPSSVVASSLSGSTSVSVSWNSASLSTGQVPDGYYVTRRNTTTNAVSPACGSNASSLRTATSCTDTSVPSATYTYTVVAVFRSWTAPSSPSASVTVQGDVTAPTSSATAPAATKASPFAVSFSASDNAGGSGVAKVDLFVRKPGDSTFSPAGTNTSPGVTGTFSYTPGAGQGSYAFYTRATDQAGNTETTSAAQTTTVYDTTAPATTDNAPSGWKNTAVTVTLAPTDTAGSGVSSTSYRIDNGATQTGTTVTVPAPSDHSNDGTHTITYFSTDAAGNAESSKTATVKIDTSAPSGGSISYPDGYSSSPSASIAFTSGTDALSGISSRQVQRQTATLNVDTATCGSPGSFTTIAAEPASSPVTDSLTSGNCSVYRYMVTDAAGNAATYTSPATVKYDTSAAPQLTSASSANVGPTVGLMQATDTLTLVFSKGLDPSTVPATATVTESRSGSSTTFAIPGVIQGPVTISNSYMSGGASGTSTATVSLSADHRTMTLTLGTVSTTGGGPAQGTGPVSVRPAAGFKDHAGNAVNTTPSAAISRLF